MNQFSRRLSFEYWLPLLVWICSIYWFSTESFSGDQTSRIFGPILQFLFPGLSVEQMQAAHGLIRKLAHVAAYFILALLTYRAFRRTPADPLRAKVLTAAFVVLTGLGDEFHQSMTVSRVGSLTDVGYDTLGGILALSLITLYENRRIRPHTLL